MSGQALSVVCWKWGDLFSAAYVNRLRAGLARHLTVRHELVCVTDDAAGLDRRVRVVPMPARHSSTPRCRRRMQAYSREFALAHNLGPRLLCVDLDVVVVGRLDHLVERPEPLVVAPAVYTPVFCGALILVDAGYLDGAWRAFDADPEGFPREADPVGQVPSDQAMLNHFVMSRGVPHGEWSSRDGVVLYFGTRRYQQHEHLGVGPTRPRLPQRARIVLFGSADKAVIEEGRLGWIREHWGDLPGEACA